MSGLLAEQFQPHAWGSLGWGWFCFRGRTGEVPPAGLNRRKPDRLKKVLCFRSPTGGSLSLPQELGEYAWRHVALRIHQGSLSSWAVCARARDSQELQLPAHSTERRKRSVRSGWLRSSTPAGGMRHGSAGWSDARRHRYRAGGWTTRIISRPPGMLRISELI